MLKPEFLEELTKKEINAEVLTQPANSADTNLLDLIFHVVHVCK